MASYTQQYARNLRYAVWGGIFLIGFTIMVNAMQRRKETLVSGIIVDITPIENGSFLIDESDIPALLEERFAQPLESLPVGKVNVERLERVLEEDPFVKQAEAWVDAQSRVHIAIEQRMPLLRVIDNNGLNYYLDKEGSNMPPSRHFAARVRVATGNLPPWEERFLRDTGSVLTHVYRLNELLMADEFLDALIEQIYVNKRGELILSPKIGKQTIQFGRYQDAEAKLERLKTFYREGLPYKGWKAYRSFDLRYNGQVVCVKR
ncbi:MAG: cell division protein FtsQ/DivIB [Saprospiraceae bacterium]